MCVMSVIMDDFSKKWPAFYPEPHIVPFPNLPSQLPGMVPQNTVSQLEFEQLKKEVQALKELLKAAKIFDEKTGQPDCEMKEKVDLIKKIASVVGVDLSELVSG